MLARCETILVQDRQPGQVCSSFAGLEVQLKVSFIMPLQFANGSTSPT